MEARVPVTFFTLTICLTILLGGDFQQVSQAATYRTANFVVTAPTPEFAERVGLEAERFRRELSRIWGTPEAWGGKAEMPNWQQPCPIRVKVGQIGAGGATTFSFHNGEVFGWQMDIQGTEERILDSVLPHEITHTILACRFRRPLPRWADEGICTLVEHESERRRQTRLLGDVMRSGRKIPLKSLMVMTEYPPDMQDVMKLYAQGYSLTDFLVQQGGRDTFMKFLGDALRHGSWDQALSAHYGINRIDQLEQKWDKWVLAGSPALNLPAGQELANQRQPARNTTTVAELDPETVVRGQSPEETARPTRDSNAPQISDPLENSRHLDSAPLFATQAPTRTNDQMQAPQGRTQHQSARSRQDLLQPVYSTPHRETAQSSPQRSREHLQPTREGFQSPATPLTSRDRVHPFAGGTESDPFTP